MADDKKPYISKSYLITQFKSFKKYIDGIFLPQINPSVTGNLTIDGEIIDKSGNSKIQVFENKDTLDGFSENSEGGLIWNGAPIEGGGGGGGASDAIDVAYDNATSELEAENVQEAIDELDKYVDDNKLDYRVEERKLVVGGGLGQKHNYSTDEQIVGTWIDGKPIYEKVLVLPELIGIMPNTWYIIPNFDFSFCKDCVYCGGMNDTGAYFPISGGKADNKLQIMTYRNAAVGITKIILKYTKTTD